jgi:serine protease Do
VKAPETEEAPDTSAQEAPDTSAQEAPDTSAQETPDTSAQETSETKKGAEAPAQETDFDLDFEITIEEDESERDQAEKSDEPKTETSAEPKTEKGGKEKKSLALPVSCILSACSILLLLAFAGAIFLGLIPIGGNGTANVGVSNLGQTQAGTEASPDLLEASLKSVVLVQARNDTSISTGTGVIISENGYVVTNHHVIEGMDKVTVQLYGEDIAIEAAVIGFHADDDVAVLKIDRDGLRAAPFARSDDVRYGEKVYAIGNPEGAEFSWSITEGIVSCPKRQLMFYDAEGILEKKMNVVQTDAAVNHGNSGGPIINVRGEIVGIVTLKRTDSAGMGFALPADGVLIDVTAIIETGSAAHVSSGIYMPRPLLGITGVGVKGETYYRNVVQDGQSMIEEVDEDFAKANPKNTFYAPVTGVHVSAVSAGSDSARYLRVNDVITEVNGKPVVTIYDIMDIVNEFNGGDQVSITYYRNGEYKTVKVTLKTSREIG